MANTLANLATTLALGSGEDMTIPVCAKWVVTPSKDKLVQEASAVSFNEVKMEDWHRSLID